MKTICAALGMAALLTFSASADTLTLPKGHVLDFGDTVDVLDGRQTYFGELRVYQLRANTPEAFYESLVLSFSVDHKNPGKEKNGLLPFVKLMGKEMTDTAGSTAAKQEAADKKNAVIPFAGKMWKEAEIGEPYKQFLGKKGIRLYVSSETHWKEKKSRGGKVYRLAKAKAGLYTGGCLIPFFAEGLILEDGDSTTYTLFTGDQKSGAYFVPYVEKAAQEMK